MFAIWTSQDRILEWS